MTPEEKAWHDREQFRSFVRGQCPSDRDYEKWCADVDHLLPPLPRPAAKQADDHSYLYEHVVRVASNGQVCRLWVADGDFSLNGMIDSVISVLIYGGSRQEKLREIAGMKGVNSAEIVDVNGNGMCVHKDWP